VTEPTAPGTTSTPAPGTTSTPAPGTTSTPAADRDLERDPEEARGPIIRDKRRIDPETGAVRPTSPWQPAGGTPPAGQAAPEAGVPDAEAAPALEQQLAERTSDLQRVQAEYANYRRRVERDRAVNRDLAVAAVLTNFLPVLDDIGRAREHDELEGGFRSVGEALEQMVEKLGLTRFGDPGDAFDPNLHEAVTHGHSAEVNQPTCVQIFSPGYRISDRVVRPARVAVVEPE
jgi:molecular chaperone GrpE